MLRYLEIIKEKRYESTWAFKIVFSLALLCLLFYQLRVKASHGISWAGVVCTLDATSVSLIFAVLALMVINWGLEALKWKWLLKTTQPLSTHESFKSVLCGVAVSLFTPNRAGDFIGRLAYINSENKLPAIALSVTGSLAQWIATMVAGAIALLFVIVGMVDANISSNIIQPLFLIVILLCVLSFAFYYNINRLTGFVTHIKWVGKYVSKFNSSRQPVKLLNKVLAFSLLRYIVFIVQYFLLLKAFGILLPPFQAFTLLSLNFLAITLIPTFFPGEPGLRSNVALFFLYSGTGNEWGIVCAAVLVWIINLVIPALAGGAIILHRKTDNYEKKNLA